VTSDLRIIKENLIFCPDHHIFSVLFQNVITNIIILQEEVLDCLSFSDILITILPTPFVLCLVLALILIKDTLVALTALS